MKKTLFYRHSFVGNPGFKAFVFVVPGLFAASAFAGTTGAEFQGFFDLILSWTTGYLAKGLALAAFLLGAALGMVKGTMLPALVGIGFAIMFTVGPGVINGMLTATI